MQRTTTKFLNWLIALILTYLAVGLGQLYKGDWCKALVLQGIALGLVATLKYFGAFDIFWTAALTIGASLAVFVWASWDAHKGLLDRRKIQWFNHWMMCVGFVILAWLFGHLIFPNSHNAFSINSTGQSPTLEIGDRIIVDTSYYQKKLPAHGEIIVFQPPDPRDEAESEFLVLKRIVGLPGDTVEVKGTMVYLNSKPLDEPYARWIEGGSATGNFAETVVPPNKVFVLGDNRDRSRDSRFYTEKFIPMTSIRGKALYIYWSWDDISRIGMKVG